MVHQSEGSRVRRPTNPKAHESDCLIVNHSTVIIPTIRLVHVSKRYSTGSFFYNPQCKTGSQGHKFYRTSGPSDYRTLELMGLQTSGPTTSECRALGEGATTTYFNVKGLTSGPRTRNLPMLSESATTRLIK